MAVPITKPIIGTEEQAAVAEVLASGYLVQGPRVAAFERLVADSVGVEHAVAVTNCTAALHLALLALGVGPGDRVAVAPYSWVATANVIELAGATPVFVDIDPSTFNMSTTLLDGLLTTDPTVKAVMPVHTFGNPAGMAHLVAVASRHGVPTIEDAACALGAVDGDSPAGSMGVMGCFSFHPRKIITTAEGGMLVTDRLDLAEYARSYRNHGQRPIEGRVEFVMAGGNLRLTEIQGALGVVQMGRLGELVRVRGDLAARYDELLGEHGLTSQARGVGAAVQSYVTLVPAGRSAAPIIDELRSNGIEVTIGTNAIPFTRHFSERYGLTADDLPATADVFHRAITLPLFPGMTIDEQDAVVAGLVGSLR